MSCPTSPCAAHVEDSLWYELQLPQPRMWSGIHSPTFHTAWIWRLSNVVGGGKSSRIFSLPEKWFTTSDFKKNGKLTHSVLHQENSLYRRENRARKDNVLMTTEEVYFQTKQKLCASPTQTWKMCLLNILQWRLSNKLLCFIGRSNKLYNLYEKQRGHYRLLDLYLSYAIKFIAYKVNGHG